MRAETDIVQAIEMHGDTVWRVCVLYFKQSADAQDAFQETLIKYSLAATTTFKDEEHRKAWLITVARNVCKDMLKAAHRSNLSIDEDTVQSRYEPQDLSERTDSALKEIIEAIQALDDPPRTPVYLALYEGYTAPEIASMLDAPVNTVYSWIARGKQHLKEVLK